MATSKKKTAKTGTTKAKKTPSKTSSAIKSTKRRNDTLPIVPQEKVLENESRTLFQQAMHPWLVTGWDQHDYGIDVMVEVAQPRVGSRDLHATGKRFAVQLKATEQTIADSFAVSIPTRTVRYWFESTEPVMLVACHVPSKGLWYRWIDEELSQQLNAYRSDWGFQESVTIHVESKNPINIQALPEIERRVMRHARRGVKTLEPGLYFRKQEEAVKAGQALSEMARRRGLESIRTRIERLHENLRNATYMIALAGPSRAGKSTLTNGLVGRDLSPVSKLPTTAVSILVTAGAEDEAEVVFLSGESRKGPAAASFLAQYATLDENPDNRKGVQNIVAKLRNEVLEKGIAYVDAPGLRDPSPEIRVVTQRALERADAIVYMLDAAPAAHGGFSLDATAIDELRLLAGSADKLFIVLNKADVLSESDRADVLRHMEERLKKYDLWPRISHAPIFLSARDAWAFVQGNGGGASPLKELDSALWKHLLESRSTGVQRLRVAVEELQRAVEEARYLLEEGQDKARAARVLDESIKTCRQRREELLRRCDDECVAQEKFVLERLQEYREAYLGYLQEQLEKIPLNGALPKANQVVEEMREDFAGYCMNLWDKTVLRATSFSTEVDREIEQALRQARLASDVPGNDGLDIPSMAQARDNVTDAPYEAIAGLVFGGILFGLGLGEAGVAIGSMLGAVFGFFAGMESQRKREIKSRLKRAEAALDASIGRIRSNMSAKVRSFYGRLKSQVEDRIRVFLHDVQQKLARVGRPLTDDEARDMATTRQELAALSPRVLMLCAEIERLYGE